MKDVVRKEKERHMKHIADSFGWLIKEKLTSIDNMTRKMQSEMALEGVPKAMMAEYLPKYFAELKREVVAEQNERYEKGE